MGNIYLRRGVIMVQIRGEILVNTQKGVEQNSFIRTDNDDVLYYVGTEVIDNTFSGIRMIHKGNRRFDFYSGIFEYDTLSEKVYEVSPQDIALTYVGDEMIHSEFMKSIEKRVTYGEDIADRVLFFSETGDYNPEKNKFVWSVLSDLFMIQGNAVAGLYQGKLYLTNIKLVSSHDKKILREFEDIVFSETLAIEDDSKENLIIEAYLKNLSYSDARNIIQRVILREK